MNRKNIEATPPIPIDRPSLLSIKLNALVIVTSQKTEHTRFKISSKIVPVLRMKSEEENILTCIP